MHDVAHYCKRAGEDDERRNNSQPQRHSSARFAQDSFPVSDVQLDDLGLRLARLHKLLNVGAHGLYRFVEPVVLLLVKRKGRAYGYDLSTDLQEHALPDAEIERAAL